MRHQILIIKRSSMVGLYSGYWYGVAGFLEDGNTPEEQAGVELKEEIDIDDKQIQSISFKEAFDCYDREYKKNMGYAPRTS
jgi:ADP-ribose pyrophosphatase YjhB (NUDIX family)